MSSCEIQSINRTSLLDFVFPDVLALCTEMRPVIMVDYGGMMPELQERLCGLLRFCQQVCPMLISYNSR